MPCTTTVDCPGCPPRRALTFDALGLIKVIEAREKGAGVAKVVERWGDPDASKCVLAASMNDRKIDPVTVARKNGVVSSLFLLPLFIEIFNPLNGELYRTVSDVSNAGVRPEDDAAFVQKTESGVNPELILVPQKHGMYVARVISCFPKWMGVKAMPYLEGEQVKHVAADLAVHEAQSIGEIETEDETEKRAMKRKKSSSKENKEGKKKKKSSKEKEGIKKLKSKKRSKNQEHDIAAADDA
ncbi:hypothetical protein ES332_D13G221600v1 [Gossypium tomentosum]|uniref:Uncharacterized protein n=1 Tax=Gossypium tomentosum TaxID=34277 RepID=A0A5D2I048_GOSTO|nr:hypothetical protein ES332_D13G221600v1 [Gossypium tomentosum]